jgi:hypothetical protein
MQTTSYERFAGICAVLAGISGFLYAVAFIIIQQSSPALGALLSALFLLLLGLFSSAAQVGVYGRLREVAPQFALWALILAMVAAFGSAVHGGYDLANALNPPSAPIPDFPNQTDPRGLLTFGVAGLALLMVSWLIVGSGRLPRGLGYLGYLSALLLIILYLGRLIVLSASSPIILGPALLNGFIVSPIWYVWLGLALLRRETI